MKKSILTTMMCLLAISISAQQPVSPNGRLSVDNTAQGFSVSYLQQPALQHELPLSILFLIHTLPSYQC